MANEPHPELVIIKRHGSHDADHHGGAWKIAFADFMTAMMALFLVLWLISATNPKQRVVISRYFNPITLTEATSAKKGLNDPDDSGGPSASPSRSEEKKEKKLELPQAPEKRSLFNLGGQGKRDEAAMFRDPYAVLAEIASQQEQDEKAPGVPGTDGVGKGGPKAAAVTSENGDAFRDPFATIPQADQGPASYQNAGASVQAQAAAVEQNAVSPAPNSNAPEENASAFTSPADPAAGRVAAPPENSAKAATEAPAVRTQDAPQMLSQGPGSIKEKAASSSKNQTHAAVDQPLSQQASAEMRAQLATADAHANEAEAGKLQKELATAMHKDASSQTIPNVEVKSTSEGVLISLTDESNYAMFAVGSAEPQPKTIEVMAKVAQLLKGHPGLIVVRGHTDGRPYKTGTFDNWQLSAARAQMAHYMLVRGGLDEKRIDRIEGYADHRLKTASDPLAAENRRIEILVRKDKP
jgi:chemotaxis protein MotB